MVGILLDLVHSVFVLELRPLYVFKVFLESSVQTLGSIILCSHGL
ncbi:hypothetical protein [Escherichia phage UPEC01]|nr:hypothetical protein [Escherichia phage UPEC01]